MASDIRYIWTKAKLLDSSKKIEYTLDEYHRLLDRRHTLIDSAFDDFKYFGVVGGVFSLLISVINIDAVAKWISGPGPESVLPPAVDAGKISFLIGILTFLLIALISARDLLRQSYVAHLSFNIWQLESLLREEILNRPEREQEKAYSFMNSWYADYGKKLTKAYLFFMAIFSMLLAIIPGSLYVLGFVKYGHIMTSLILISLTIYLIILSKIYRDPRKGQASTSH